MACRRIVRARSEVMQLTEPMNNSEPLTVSTIIPSVLPTNSIHIYRFKDIVYKNRLFSQYSIDNIINDAIIRLNLDLDSEYNYQMLENIFSFIKMLYSNT